MPGFMTRLGSAGLSVSKRGASWLSRNNGLNCHVEGDIEMKGRGGSREGRKMGKTPLTNERAAVQCSPSVYVAELGMRVIRD